MWDTRPVELVLHLPEELADDVQEVQRDDPDFLKKVIRYGLTRRAIFEQLNCPDGPAGARTEEMA